MTSKTLLAALVLAFSPIAAYAACGGEHAQTASCDTGSSWNYELGKCVVDATG